MYKVLAGSKTLFDSTKKDTYPATDASISMGLNDAGSMEMTLHPGHANYAEGKKIHSFVTAYRDDEEIFYGRLLTYETDMFGSLKIYAEGALTFLLDSELGKGTYEESVSAFFRRCINAHNAQVEAAKQFTIGTIRADKASTTNKFEISGWTTVKNAIESQLIQQYGGYLVIRPKNGGGHYIDYIANYGTVTDRLIRIGQNVISKDDKRSGENIFTILRPVGANDLALDSGAHVTIPNCTLNNGTLELTDLIAKYGRIVHTENFSGVSTSAELLTEAETYITKRRSKLPSVCEVSYVDFHYLNPSLPYMKLGDRFTNIEGFSGEAMTVSDISIDLDDPSNDEATLKNDEELEIDNPSSTGRNASSLSAASSTSSHGGLSGMGGVQYKYITESEKLLQLHTDTIQITAEKELQLSSMLTYITSRNMYLLAYDDPQQPGSIKIGVCKKLDDGTDQEGATMEFTFDNLRIKNSTSTTKKLESTEVTEIQGSELWVQRDKITAINGKMYVGDDGKLHVVQGAGMVADGANGATFGYYTSNNLTAGVIVDKINGNAAQRAALGFYDNDTLTAGIMVNKINADSSVTIQANRINLNGYVTTNGLSSGEYTISGRTVSSANGSFDSLSALSAGISELRIQESISGDPWKTHHHTMTANADGTISMGDVTYNAVSFNIADTKFYQDAVSAAEASVTVPKSGIKQYQTAGWDSENEQYEVYVQATASNGKYGRNTLMVSGYTAMRSVTLTSDDSSISASSASSSQISIGTISKTSQHIDVPVYVTLSNGRRYGRTITDISTGFTKENLKLYYKGSDDDYYVYSGTLYRYTG